MAFDTKESTRDNLRAVVHPYDFTARPQILERDINPTYYDIIKEFGDITGTYVILNTSFNLHGSPIAMSDWIEDVPAVIEAWYPGLEGGNVIADILFGDVNPSGKLPITFPKKLEDSPAHKSERTYPGIKERINNSKPLKKVFYDEGIFVGYRHFDKNNIEPLFPFGYGLSYTTFKYENLKIKKAEISKNDKIEISVDITNTGNRNGAEIMQIYINDCECSAERPPKELKAFKKVFLEPGEKQTINFELYPNILSFFDPKSNKWIIESGKFKVLVASSSRDIKLEGEIDYIE